MSEERFKSSRSALAFSQALSDKLLRQQTAQQQDEMPQEQEPHEQPEVEQKEVEPTQPSVDNQPKESSASGTNDLTSTITAGFEALNKLADAIKEEAKTRKTNITSLRGRLAGRKNKQNE